MRFFASRMSPVAPYFFLIASSSASLRSRNRSSNAVSKACFSFSAVSAVRPSYRICSVAPSCTESMIRYTSISSPNRLCVRFSPWRSVISGVPVKAMRVALGNASNRFSPRSELCVRCASSIISTMRLDGFTTPKVWPAGMAR